MLCQTHSIWGTDANETFTPWYVTPSVDGCPRGEKPSNADNRIWGEGGHDYIYAAGGDDTIEGGHGNDTAYGGSGDDRLIGGIGSNAQETGDDYLNGGSGNDTIHGQDGDDSLSGSSGDDSITGGYGDDTLDGGTGNDTLYAHFGNDVLSGGDGDDYLVGNTGKDVLTGGQGADSFVFHDRETGLVPNAADVITDFRWYEGDKIVLRWTDVTHFGGKDSWPEQNEISYWHSDYGNDGDMDTIISFNSKGQVHDIVLQDIELEVWASDIIF